MIISAGNHWEAPCDFCQVVAQMLLEATASHSHGYVFTLKAAVACTHTHDQLGPELNIQIKS